MYRTYDVDGKGTRRDSSTRVGIDPGTPFGQKGSQYSHFHLNGGKEHIYDYSRWPWYNLKK